MPNNLIKFAAGLQNAYNNLSPKDASTLYYCTDTKRLFLGTSEYTRPISVGTTAPASNTANQYPPYSLYFDYDSEDGGSLYYTDGSAWHLIYSLSNIAAELNSGVTSISSSGEILEYILRSGQRISFDHPAIFAVKGTQNAATNAWTGSIPLTELYDGLCIAYYLPYNGTSSNATLNLTLAGPSGTGTATTGAIAVYWGNNTRTTKQYEAGSTIFLTYWSANSIGVAGTTQTAASWRTFQYNTNSTYNYEAIYSTTAAGTAAKVGTSSGYTLQTGHFAFWLKNSNTVQSKLTLNISSTGAKDIWLNGMVSSSSNYIWPTGYYIGYYDGSVYHFRTDGVLPGPVEKLNHTLTIGSLTFDGTSDVTIPVYGGSISSTTNTPVS